MEQRYKYPRTNHLPWSLGATSDDKVLKSLEHFEGMNVVVTEKMDGENTTLYRDGLHARSVDGKYHESRDWIKADWMSKSYLLNPGLRICGENLFAKHSLKYETLYSYFYGFSLWEGEKCFDWDTTVKTLSHFGYPTPKFLWSGVFDEKTIRSIVVDANVMEGYVVRNADSFMLKDFGVNVTKYVRANHVQTEDHWMHAEIERNGIV